MLVGNSIKIYNIIKNRASSSRVTNKPLQWNTQCLSQYLLTLVLVLLVYRKHYISVPVIRSNVAYNSSRYKT